jgi:RING finger protein 113A
MKRKYRKKNSSSGSESEHEIKTSLQLLKKNNQLKSNKSNQLKSNESTQLNKTSQSSESELGVAFKSSGTACSIVENTAFRTLDIDSNNTIKNINTNSDDLYSGLSNYKEYVNKTKDKITQKNAGGIRPGPLKGVSNVRITCRFDYAAGVCKDYKEIGYCGFGDSCVFMHDRSDYKQGWQLEQEWEQAQKEAVVDTDYFVGVEEDVVESDDDLPFACFICRKSFVNPIVTRYV